MGLQLQASAVTTARLPKIKLLDDLRKPGEITRLVFLNLIIRSFDKGKPVEKRGRKAKDLKSRAA